MGHSRENRPIPFVRLDALFLLLAWFIPYFPVSGRTLNDALGMAALFVPISYSWAAGDVSLNAYIQSNLIDLELVKPGVSTLASIMSFLYVTYVSTTLCAPSHVHSHSTFQIITYTLSSSLLGLLVDTVLGKDNACSPNFRSDIKTGLMYVSGVGGSLSTSLDLTHHLAL